MSAASIYAPKKHGLTTQTPQPHTAQAESAKQYMASPVLYLSGIDPTLTDKELAGEVFQHVLPIRPKIDRSVTAETVSGSIEFETLSKAEKAYATIRPPFALRMSLTGPDPVAQAKPRLIKNLPLHVDEIMVYDLFRPFGSLYRVRCVLSNPHSRPMGFKGVAVVEFYSEQDAQQAQDRMHCINIEGNSISVVIDNTAAKRENVINGASVPNITLKPAQGLSAVAPAFAPSSSNVSNGSRASMHAPKSEASTAQTPARVADSVDPCNLFVKNLDADTDSDQLFHAFRTFGRIVSARVMREADGKSREFGFVSYTTPVEANRAIDAMNDAIVGTKKITVCLHEPKFVRREKLAARFTAPTETVAVHEQEETFDTHGTELKEPTVPDTSAVSLTSVPVQRIVSNTSSNVDNASIISSTPASAKERVKLLKAVTSICEGGALVDDITGMLASLSRKERALCLFNPEVLKAKVEEAKEILDITDDSAEEFAPATPAEGDLLAQKAEIPLTVAALAALPASEILRIANLPPSAISAGLPLPKPEPEVLKSTNEFIDSLADRTLQDQKQKLGDQLFKKIRSFGVKGAPKITVHLLDTEDLRALAHLMNSYEAVLREKVLQTAAHIIAK